MKKIGKLVFPFLLVFFLFISTNIKAETNRNQCYECIENYHLQLDVKNNGIIHVKQDLQYYFGSAKHGIYVSVPEFYFMNFDNTYKAYYWRVDKIVVANDHYNIDQQLKGKVIKIGDEDRLVSGNHHYTIEYDIHSTDLKYHDLEMLYYNIVGSGWNIPILKTSFEIKMPKEFKGKPYFYPPQSSQTKVITDINNQKITGSFNDVIYPGEALTIKLDLPNDYFSFNNNTKIPLIFLGCTMVLLVGGIILFIKYGRDDKIITTVEFQAPDQLSSAEVGYLANNSDFSKNIISLFVYWASKGYLKIRQDSEDKFTFIKIKDIDDHIMSYERSLFKALFNKSDEVASDQLPEGYTDLYTDGSFEYRNHFKGQKAIFEKKASKVQLILGILSFIITPFFIGLLAFNITHSFLIGIATLLITLVLFLISGFLLYSNFTNHFIISKSKRFIKIFASMIGIIIFNIIIYIPIMLLSITYLPLLMGINISFIIIIFVALMSKRTPFYNHVMGQILGLRNFITLVEKDRLELLVHDNPVLFYDILPFAYVLNVSDVWIKNFEHINMVAPDWYDGSLYNGYAFNNIFIYSMLFNSVHTNVESNMIDFGDKTGGFSSGGFGGGGFSGGGFGGGGGGSW
ncbi:MAG: DUF2207 domain-containing protein [Bacilli bacterium]|jgi:uncharacterized membrane protein YgcG|nr:DUF2207 domain-containing protein [Bacilli bacterium]